MTAEGDLDGRLRAALDTGDDGPLREALLAGSGLPGPRMNLRLVTAFADAAGAVVRPSATGAAGAVARPPATGAAELEALLDRWAALDAERAPGDRPAVILPCAAMAAYGAVGVARPDWRDDELTKLRRGARDPRWRVRELVATALQHLLAADWNNVLATLEDWAVDADALVIRAAAAAVAEPPLLTTPERAADAARLLALAVDAYARAGRTRAAPPAPDRHTGDAGLTALRTTLGFALSVPTAVTGDFTLLHRLAASPDPDLRWVARRNLRAKRLSRWPDQVTALRDALDITPPA